MFAPLDTPLDWFRIVVLLCCLVCMAGLLYRRFRPPHEEWNPKTKDYWFALFMFSVAGASATVEGQFRLVFTFIAALVCMNGLRRKGRWRGDQT